MEYSSHSLREREPEPDSIANFFIDHFVPLRTYSPPALTDNWILRSPSGGAS
jgi:hypothetical protein